MAKRRIKRTKTARSDPMQPSAKALWRETFGKELPKALTRDLLLRMVAWHIQEQAFGGHDRATLKMLESYARGRPGETRKFRYLKPGTEIVREYQGERHTVVVTAAGFQWRDGDYLSLTAIARIITGTSCNGPRFFGLRIPSEGQNAGIARPNRAVGKKLATEPKKAGEAWP